jgi:hypothetical protein
MFSKYAVAEYLFVYSSCWKFCLFRFLFDRCDVDTYGYGVAQFVHGIVTWLAKNSCARIYRPCFRENQPKRSFSIKWKRAFWACFRENWVYKFGHWDWFSDLGLLPRQKFCISFSFKNQIIQCQRFSDRPFYLLSPVIFPRTKSA